MRITFSSFLFISPFFFFYELHGREFLSMVAHFSYDIVCFTHTFLPFFSFRFCICICRSPSPFADSRTLLSCSRSFYIFTVLLNFFMYHSLAVV